MSCELRAKRGNIEIVKQYSKVEVFINTKEIIENLHNRRNVVAKDLWIFFEDIGENQLLRGQSKERARVKKQLSIGEFSYLQETFLIL